MRRGIIVGGLILSLASGGCSRRPATPEQAIARVDARIYYPQRQGLRHLSARVHCPQLDDYLQKQVESDAEAAAYFQGMMPLEIRFVWEPVRGGRYEYRNVPESETEFRAFLDRIFRGTEILVVPPTEAENFQPFHVNFSRWDGKYRLLGVNKNPEADFTQYTVETDKNFQIVRKQYFSRSFVSTSFPSYREENHYWLLTALNTVQKGDGEEPEVLSEVKLNYQQTQGYWLVQKLEYVFKQKSPEGERPFRGPWTIVFSDYQLHQAGAKP